MKHVLLYIDILKVSYIEVPVAGPVKMALALMRERERESNDEMRRRRPKVVYLATKAMFILLLGGGL